jgi:hypothetical protein
MRDALRLRTSTATGVSTCSSLCHGWDGDPFPGEQNRLYLSERGGGWRDATGSLPQLNDYTHALAVGDLSARGVLDIVAEIVLSSRRTASTHTHC